MAFDAHSPCGEPCDSGANFYSSSGKRAIGSGEGCCACEEPLETGDQPVGHILSRVTHLLNGIVQPAHRSLLCRC